jgi:hypothetical protein
MPWHHDRPADALALALLVVLGRTEAHTDWRHRP